MTLFVISMVWVSSAATDPAFEAWRSTSGYVALSDTDSVAIDARGMDSLAVDVLAMDTLDVDSLGADSLFLPDSALVWDYIPAFRRDALSASPDRRDRLVMSPSLGQWWRHDVEFDTLARAYTIREKVGEWDARYPVRLEFDEYRAARLDEDLDGNWRELILQRERQDEQRRRGGLGFNIVVPGGRQSAFRTIFGANEVDLRVNGTADIHAGFDYRKSDQQVSVTGKPSQLDPEFKQDLSLGITGTIGDKLRINVNYDSRNQFDFQNQLKLEYTGYEDEIVQKIEAGNVFLQTPSSLIRGGQSLFGIKSEFQLGGVRLTTVMSQQEGQSNSLNIEGGSEQTEFDLRPTDYDEATHFFLSYYFRNRFEDALSDPPNIRVANGFERITEIEVWKLMPTRPEEENVRQVVAMVDLGEPQEVLSQANQYTLERLPGNDIDQYDDADGGEIDTELRDGDAAPGSYLETVKNLSSSDFQVGKFKRLERGRDYDVDEVLGYVTMRQRIQESEALAIAFRFRAGGRTYQVGDFSTDTGGSDGGQNEDKIVLKLIRPVQLRQPAPEADFNPAAWYLEMRNIYRLPGRSIQPNEFDLQVYYEPPGKTASKTLPGVGGTNTILQLTGLDRVNEDQALVADDQFDFLVNYTIVPGEGTLIFPYLEPFGNRISNVVTAGGGTTEAQDGLREIYVFESLYSQKKANARRNSQHDVYRIRGSYRGSVQSSYDLNAFSGVVQGSVRVTSGGTPLSEGTDFVVEYSGTGLVQIINPAFLTAGRDIEIEFEQNSFFNIQKKTLVGMRADYTMDERLSLGATVMRMNQQSPIDKFRIGEEPISNTIWGVDGALELEPRWMTRAIDFVPLLQTREPSSISISGEFAQLRPGNTQTIAFERTRRELQDAGRDFNRDELGGTSYIDDFEGFENTFTMMQPGSWGLASAPDSIGAVDRFGPATGIKADSLRTNWRGNFAWYRINANMLREIPTIAFNADAIRIFRIDEVFPNRDTRAEIDPTLETYDIYFNPNERGPYNYTRDLRGFLDNPKYTWGGMTQRLPEGFTDFSLKNIDFVEFVFQPFPENAQGDAGTDAVLYVDLGSISEDILPDEKLNNEDGLSTATITEGGILNWGRSPTGAQNSVVDIDDASRRTEDLGLDGLSSGSSEYPPFATEEIHFADFLSSLDRGSSDPRYRAEVAKALADPSGDDYHYFGNTQYYQNSEFYPAPATFQQHFSRYFAGHELNAFETQTKLANNTSVRRGNSRFPDSEDRNLNSTVDTENSYFQYEIPLSKRSLDSLAVPERVDDYIVGEVADADGNGTGWYQVRIPVQQFTRRVGDIQDFSLIEFIRIWTTGHEVPFTARFASLELVGSQWQKSEAITLERETPFDTTGTETRLTISSINNEENAETYQPPIGAVVSQSRLASGRVQNAREQSLVIRAENLGPGQQRAIFKTQNAGVDLLKYSNLRMFVHAHGQLADGTDLASLPLEESRTKATLFVRLGSNETNDYYEYEQPLTPSYETAGNSDELWRTAVDYEGQFRDLGSMNIELGALNQLKVARDRIAFPTDSTFWSTTGGELTTADSPDASLFAPPGTRLGIRGTPSLGKVNAIVIGVRNPADSTLFGSEYILEDITLWVNELRVAGYDSENGWAALSNMDIKLADLGRVKASFQRQTDGFGSLSSSLGEREQLNINNWTVTTEVNADKLIPERFGWTLPVNVQIQSNTTTPRFSPTRGDIRLEEILDQIDQREDLTVQEKEAARTEATEAAQTYTLSKSLSTRLGKTGSRNKILRNTVDGISLSYSQAESNGRSPSQEVNDSWRWSSSMGYRFQSRNPKTLRPFFFLDGVPLLRTLGGLNFNYLPSLVSTSGSFRRQFSQTRERPVVTAGDTTSTPFEVRFPLREKHTFSHGRDFQFQYNPFNFLNLSFDTKTQQSFNTAGVDTLYNVVTPDTTLFGIQLDEAIAAGLLAENQLGNAFEVGQLSVVSGPNVLGRFLSGGIVPRTETHGQVFRASFRPQLRAIGFLNWLQIQDIGYNATFDWQNGPVGRNNGAAIRNGVELRGGVSLRIQDLWRKFAFYESIEDAQDEYQRAKETARRMKAKAREERRAAKENEEESPDNPAAQGPPTEETQKDRGPGFKGRLYSYARQLMLTATGIRDFNLTYQDSRTSSSSNVGTPVLDADGNVLDVTTYYGLRDALKGNGASLGYRFGFDRQFDIEDRIVDPSLQVSDLLNDSKRFQGRTTLNPSQALNVTLNWNLDLSESQTYTFRPALDDLGMMVGIDTTITQSGNNKASIWAFGANYLDLFQSQLNTFTSDLIATGQEDPILIPDADGNGRSTLTNASVVNDFREAFVRGSATVDQLGIAPFPKPTWQVTYSGLSDWPILRRLTQSVSLRHAYSGDYAADFNTNTAFASDDTLRTVDLASRRIQFVVEEYQVNNVRINESFRPLIGVDISWKGAISTGFTWSKSNSYSLSTANFEVSENKTTELGVTVSYQKSGLKLPFFRKLNNRLQLQLNITRSETLDQRLRLRRALEQAITDPEFTLQNALEGDNISLVTAHTRLIMTPRIAYQFSNRVQADFTLKYEKFDSQDSRQPSSVNINGTFNIRVSIAN
ncbi:MAG: cell surface protein SprA [Rhodothermales bacterium]